MVSEEADVSDNRIITQAIEVKATDAVKYLQETCSSVTLMPTEMFIQWAQQFIYYQNFEMATLFLKTKCQPKEAENLFGHIFTKGYDFHWTNQKNLGKLIECLKLMKVNGNTMPNLNLENWIIIPDERKSECKCFRTKTFLEFLSFLLKIGFRIPNQILQKVIINMEFRFWHKVMRLLKEMLTEIPGKYDPEYFSSLFESIFSRPFGQIIETLELFSQYKIKVIGYNLEQRLLENHQRFTPGKFERLIKWIEMKEDNGN